MFKLGVLNILSDISNLFDLRRLYELYNIYGMQNLYGISILNEMKSFYYLIPYKIITKDLWPE